MATVAEAVVSLKAETVAFRRDFAAAQKSTKDFRGAVLDMGEGLKRTLAGFLTVRFAVQAIQEIATAGMEAEQATARLEGVLKATGSTAGLTARQIDELAHSMQDNTLFDDEDVKNAAAALLTFQHVQGNTFRQAIALGGDMATIFGGDLQENVVKLGKALDSPVEGVSALQRVGVRFNETEKEQIKALVESNHLLDAQAIILAKLQDKVGGAAKAMGATGLTGAVNQVKDAWHDFAESVVEGKLGEIMARQTEFVANQFREIAAMLPKASDSLEALTEKEKEYRDELDRLSRDDPNNNKQIAHYRMLLGEIDAEISLTLEARDALEAKAKAAEKAADMTTGPSAETVAKRQLEEKQRIDDIIGSVEDWTDALRRNRDEELKAANQRAKEYDQAKKIQDDLAEESKKVDETRMKGAEESAKEHEKVWQHALKNIQDDFADSFESLLDGEVTTFKGFLELILTEFRHTLAQMAAAQAASGLASLITKSLLTIPTIDTSGIYGGAANSTFGFPSGSGSYGGGLGGPALPPLGFPNLSQAAPSSGMRQVTHYHINIHAIDTQSFAQAVRNNSATVANIAVQAVKGNRAFQRLTARGAD